MDTLTDSVMKMATADPRQWTKLYPKSSSKSSIYSAYLSLVSTHQLEPNPKFATYLKKKPTRTMSGITPVTVLTKPYPCPGKCVFCPVDVRMPKSYIASEPGAQRAAQHGFDPYQQVLSRLQTYRDIGHDIGKIELIVLGGTWSVYPESYQIWFIKRLFQALNDFPQSMQLAACSLKQDFLLPHETYNDHVAKKKYLLPNESATWDELYTEHQRNETASSRCVGLVLETRPDYITTHEVIRLRKLGATKIQIGIQSINDQVLSVNKRGHYVNQTIEAFKLLRLAGFKIHAHWMPNLLGNNPTADILEYQELFENSAFRPDELKIYPCSLIPNTELVDKYESGDWSPYNQEDLTQVLSYCLTHTPEYCRLTRIVRDIPSPEIMVGNKHTNFRQMVESKLDKSLLHDIRSREIKNQSITSSNYKELVYQTLVSTEYFLQYVTDENKIIAFLRLSLSPDKAIIREVHVYGQAIDPGKQNRLVAQHQGYGKKLIKKAIEIATSNHYSKLLVISAIGTREYYRKLGFLDGELYQEFRINV